MASGIMASEKHGVWYDTPYMHGRAVGATPQSRNVAGTAEAKRTGRTASADPEGGNVWYQAGPSGAVNRSGADCTNQAFECTTKEIVVNRQNCEILPADVTLDRSPTTSKVDFGGLRRMGATDPDMPMVMPWTGT